MRWNATSPATSSERRSGRGRELEELLAVLSHSVDPDLYSASAKGIAAAIHCIHAGVMEPALAAYPDLNEEIEEQLRNYDRLL